VNQIWTKTTFIVSALSIYQYIWGVLIDLLVFQGLAIKTTVAVVLALYLYRALPARWSVNYAYDGCPLQVLQQCIDLLLTAPHQTYQLCSGSMTINKQEQVPV